MYHHIYIFQFSYCYISFGHNCPCLVCESRGPTDGQRGGPPGASQAPGTGLHGGGQATADAPHHQVRS